MSLLCSKPSCLSHFTQRKVKVLTVTHKALLDPCPLSVLSSHPLCLPQFQLHRPPPSYVNTHLEHTTPLPGSLSSKIRKAYSLTSLKSPLKRQLLGESFTEHPLSPSPSALPSLFSYSIV